MKFGIYLKLLFLAALLNNATADLCYRNSLTDETATVISSNGNSITVEFNLEALENEQTLHSYASALLSCHTLVCQPFADYVPCQDDVPEIEV